MSETKSHSVLTAPIKGGTPAAGHTPAASDVAAIDELRNLYKSMRTEMAKVIIGQDKVVEQLLICILARGHALLMGVPGLAKTTIVNALSQVMSLQFNRIQFTPDLMPSDITGTDILQETDQPGSVLKEKESLHFATMNHFELKRDIATGKGDYLSAFASTMGCPVTAQERLNTHLKTEYSRLYSNGGEVKPETVLLEVYKTILNDRDLTAKCSLGRA